MYIFLLLSSMQISVAYLNTQLVWPAGNFCTYKKKFIMFIQSVWLSQKSEIFLYIPFFFFFFFFLQFLIVLDAECVLNIIKNILESEEFNWKCVLSLAATYLICFRQAPVLLKSKYGFSFIKTTASLPQTNERLFIM